MDQTFDDIFAVLQVATTLDETKSNRIEAATKYYEAIYLMETALHRLPQTASHEAKKNLLQDKIRHYRARASELMADESSTMPKSVFLDTEETEKPVVEPKASPRSVQSDVVDVHANQANAKLSQALDLDESGKVPEAIQVYLSTFIQIQRLT